METLFVTNDEDQSTSPLKHISLFTDGEQHPIYTCLCVIGQAIKGFPVSVDHPSSNQARTNKLVLSVYRDGARKWHCPNYRRKEFELDCAKGCGVWTNDNALIQRSESVLAMERTEFYTVASVIRENLAFPRINHASMLKKRAEYAKNEQSLNEEIDAFSSQQKKFQLDSESGDNSSENTPPNSAVPYQYLSVRGDVGDDDKAPVVAWVPTVAESLAMFCSSVDDIAFSEAAAAVSKDRAQSSKDLRSKVVVDYINNDESGQYVKVNLNTDPVDFSATSSPTIFEPTINIVEKRALLWVAKHLVECGYDVPSQVSFHQDVMEGDSSSFSYIETVIDELSSSGIGRKNVALIQWMPQFLKHTLMYDFALIFPSSMTKKRVRIVPCWPSVERSNLNGGIFNSNGEGSGAAATDKPSYFTPIQIHNMAPNQIGWLFGDADLICFQTNGDYMFNGIGASDDKPVPSWKPSTVGINEWCLVSKEKLMSRLFCSTTSLSTADQPSSLTIIPPLTVTSMPTLKIATKYKPYVDHMVRKSNVNQELVDLLQNEMMSMMGFEDNEGEGDVNVGMSTNSDSAKMELDPIPNNGFTMSHPAPPFPPLTLPQRQSQTKKTSKTSANSSSHIAPHPIIHFSRHCGLCTPKSQIDSLAGIGNSASPIEISMSDLAQGRHSEPLNIHMLYNTWHKVNISGGRASDVHLIAESSEFLKFISKYQLRAEIPSPSN